MEHDIPEVDDNQIFASSAKIEARANMKQGEVDSLLEIAKARAMDPSIFDEMQPYFWGATISTNALDTYFTHMNAASLRNFAEDAQTGVAFLTSHDSRRLPLGHSLDSKFTNSRGATPARVEASFYTLRGLNTNGVPTDEFINGVRAGIIRDVSVGFYGGIFRCDICQRDMFHDWDCWHIPGVTYEKVDEDNKKIGERILATATVEDARLSEVSAVYDGATPGAAIYKAQREILHVDSRANDQRVNPEIVNLIESRYRVRLPNLNRSFATVTIPIDENTGQNDTTNVTVNIERNMNGDNVVTDDKNMSENSTTPNENLVEETHVNPEIETPGEEEIQVVHGDLTDVQPIIVEEFSTPINTDNPVGEDKEMERTQEVLLEALELAKIQLADNEDVVERAVKTLKELPALRELAELGTQYRKDLIEETIKEGIRARGSEFNVEVYKSMLEGVRDIANIKTIRDDFKGIAEAQFAGGRSIPEEVVEDVENTEIQAPTPINVRKALPNAAYRS